MKLINAFLLPCIVVIGTLLGQANKSTAATSTTGSAQTGNPAWPREKYNNGTRLIIYQPQVDDWKNFQDLSWRMTISLTPNAGKEAIPAAEMKGPTNIHNVATVAVIPNPQSTG